MPPKKTPSPASRNTNISVGGDVDGNIIVGDNNTVNQTIIQKIFNIFKSDAETVDQRNRRIMLGHVENFWVKGILEKSLHGAALLDLGIKEDPDALNYPWAIKREANKETLPAGTSMLEIFEEIGLGRSLLILGAPGSGKTTMLLELTRQLIERAREDVTEPIPVVFNLSSWTEKLTLADWLARELNVIYTIPKKIAPTWVKENKMLLLLDGLDEVRQESRDKCVDAINQFRKENGLTSMAVCSRIQDYAELKTRLSFDGAIEIQPLTSNQVNEYFKRFGKGLAGIRQVLEKDTVLREMAETPLFLSIMTLAYQNTQSKDILVYENLDVQRKHLFDTYIERMFERSGRSKNEIFKKHDVLRWLSWLAHKMIEYGAVPYSIEKTQPNWLSQKKQRYYKLIIGLFAFFFVGLATLWLIVKLIVDGIGELSEGSLIGLLFILSPTVLAMGIFTLGGLLGKIDLVHQVRWNWDRVKDGLTEGLYFGTIIGLVAGLLAGLRAGANAGLIGGLRVGLSAGLVFMFMITFLALEERKPNIQMTYPGQRIAISIRTTFFIFIFFTLVFGMSGILNIGLSGGLSVGLYSGLIFGFFLSGFAVIQHYLLRCAIVFNNLLPWHLIPFLDHCVDLIFLRRVGGGIYLRTPLIDGTFRGDVH